MSAELPPLGQTPPVGRSGLTAGFDLGALSRWPYPDAFELQAHDAADLLLLDTLQAWLDAGGYPGRHPGAPGAGDAVVVIEDRHGALTLPLLAAGLTVRVGQDALAQERSLEANLDRLGGDLPGTLHRGPVDEHLVAGAQFVLLVLPRSLDALEQWAHLVAEHAAEDVVLLAGGRDKHMTPRQNTVLGRHFASVVPGRGRSKSRVLTARGPIRGRPAPFPRTAEHLLPNVGPVTLAAFGATFGGTNVDPGTRFLLEQLGTGLSTGLAARPDTGLTTESSPGLGARPDTELTTESSPGLGARPGTRLSTESSAARGAGSSAERDAEPVATTADPGHGVESRSGVSMLGQAVDVGCGNGTIALYLALRARQAGTGAGATLDTSEPVHPTVIATDQSADACRSTSLTARLNGVEELIEVRRDDALGSFPDASESLLVLNAPFHAGNAVDTRVALRLFEASARVLRPGGELWCVWNSHLFYRPELERLLGPTRQVARDRTFTVTVSTRR